MDTKLTEPAAAQAIGVDIGGTKIAVALVDGSGRIRSRTVLPTEAELGFGRAVRRLGDAIEAVAAAANCPTQQVAGIGVGCAGPVDPRRGLINNPFTLTGWDRCDIVSPLRDRFRVPVFLENDADVAAVGECLAGAGRGSDPVVMLTFGTGIGGAAIIGGSIHRGANGEHPELGHIPVYLDGAVCYCGTRGCLESVASGTAIGEAGKAAGWHDAREVFHAAEQGVAAAQMIVGRAVEAAGAAAWTICHTLLPQCLILGGGMMDEHFELFAAAMNRRLDPATQFTRSAVRIARAQLGNDAGVVGAAAWGARRGSGFGHSYPRTEPGKRPSSSMGMSRSRAAVKPPR